jgi:hypothetical protein
VSDYVGSIGPELDAEGMMMELEHWDGLVDEQRPIPAFGPARTDEHGRVIMTDEEWEARRNAALRALRAVGDITDETDTNAIWDEVFRGLEGSR